MTDVSSPWYTRAEMVEWDTDFMRWSMSRMITCIEPPRSDVLRLCFRLSTSHYLHGGHVTAAKPLYLAFGYQSTAACTQAKTQCQAVVHTRKSSDSTLFKEKTCYRGGEGGCPNWRERNSNPFPSFHGTVSLLKQPEICDCIASLSSFHTNCISLSQSNKKLCVLEFLSWDEAHGGLQALARCGSGQGNREEHRHGRNIPYI